MTNRNFDEWLSKFRPSISSYDYYIDFEKVIKNVDEIKVELNILNSLIGSKNIEDLFEPICYIALTNPKFPAQVILSKLSLPVRLPLLPDFENHYLSDQCLDQQHNDGFSQYFAYFLGYSSIIKS
jgi:hypothetical protein